MPNSLIIHLPSSMTKVQIYQRLVEDLTKRGKSNIISQSHFFDIWKKHFSHVTIPKVIGDLAGAK